MSVDATYEPVLLEADGDETDFDFDFKVFNDTDVLVAIVDPDTLEVLDDPELGVDYTVDLNTSTTGGTVVFGTAPEDGTLVSIRRNITATQGTDIPSGGLFREVQIENALDKAVMLIQQLQEAMDRALLQSAYDTPLALVFPAPEANKVVGWNDTADGLTNYENPGAALIGAQAAQAAAEAAQGLAEDARDAAIVAQEAAEAAAASVNAGTEEASIVDGELNIDASVASSFEIEVDDDFTLNAPTNWLFVGQRITLAFTQDGSGAHVLTLGTGFLISSELAEDGIVLSTAAGAIDELGMRWDGTNVRIEAFSTDFAEPA